MTQKHDVISLLISQLHSHSGLQSIA